MSLSTVEMTSLSPQRKKRALRLQRSEATTVITKENYSSDEESAAGEQPAAEIQEAYWRDSVSTGCKCRECNHFERILKSYVIELMTSPKRARVAVPCSWHPVISLVSVYALTSATSATQHRFTCKFLGNVVCKTAIRVESTIMYFAS